MYQRRTALILLNFIVLSFFANAETPKDSLGIERKGNKILVLHKVEPGQTLSVLARLYHTTLTDIKAENPAAGDDIQPGQVLKVPYQVPAKTGTTMATTTNVTNNAVTGLHTVATSETLFSIAKAYNVSVDDLRKWNGLADNSISIGDELAISAKSARKPAPVPSTKPVTGTIAEVQAAPEQPKSGNKKTHTVAPGQTLMAISRMYKVSLSDLRKWNGLTTDNLTVGQEVIVEANTSVTAYNTEESAATDEPRAPKEKEPEPEKLTAQVQPEKVEEPVVAKPIKKEESKVAESGTGYNVPNAGSYEKKLETGLAELIEGTSENEKYLALHRTAPVGSIVQVKNLMNDLSVFVKVVGKLPDTGANDKIVVKLSRKAYERLAAVDKKFRVEVSYIP